jgi:hypothetical protein
MNAGKHFQQIGMSGFPMQAWAGALALAAAASEALVGRIASPPARPAMPAPTGPLDSAAATPASPLFAAAVEEGSNREMDWLWLATQVPAGDERHYCLLRALAINPASEIAWRELQSR